MSVELRRLGPAETYTAKEAMEQAARRAAVPRRPTLISDALREKIRQLLACGWSSEQIAGRWKSGISKDRDGMPSLSHETIYSIIAAGGPLWQLLRRGGKKARRDRCGTRRGHRLKVKPEEEIAQRPAKINGRNGALSAFCGGVVCGVLWKGSVPTRRAEAVAGAADFGLFGDCP